jgi:hypothetical protein
MNTLRSQVENPAITDLLHTLNSQIKSNKKMQVVIDATLAKHGVKYGTLNEILVNNDKIEDLNNEELCLLAYAVSEVVDNEDVYTYKKYFDQNTLQKALQYNKKDGVHFKYPFALNGVLKGSDILYSTFVSAKYLKMLWENEAITYNIEVQRLPKEKKRKDGTIYFQPDIKPKSVNDIVQLMLSGRYKSNSLILNILMDGNDEIEYSDDGVLTVYENTTINIIDGAHRLEAACKSVEQDPDFDEMIPILIYHLPLHEAQDALSQINTFNPFDKTLVKYFGNKKVSEQIVKDLISIPELNGRVRIKTTIPKGSVYLTNFAVLSEAIDVAFAPENAKDRYTVAGILKRFFGYLISAFPEFNDKLVESRESSWINHHNTFYGYVFLAKSLVDKYGENYPLEKIEEVIKSIDFAKRDGLPYNDIISPQGKVNSNIIKRNIGEFFKGIEV